MNDTSRPIDEATLTARIRGILQQQHIMTVATAAAETPWAAPVYYVLMNRDLYFFSSPDSRHIQEALRSKTAACAIYEEGPSWIDIRGLQISGRIKAVPAGLEAGGAVYAYLHRFPIVKSIFAGAHAIDLEAFYNKFHARLYCFAPETIVYMDNRIRFGFKAEISADGIAP